MIVAIDGPAGSGKSTTARRVADAVGWLYLDTGAMYRTIALAFLDREVPLTEDGAGHLLATLDLDLRMGPEGLSALLGGEDVTGRIRTPAVSEAASRVSALPAVRHRLVDEQRRIARQQNETGRGVVVEGRDIGTVVFPEADVKVYMVANPEARAERRHRELVAQGKAVSIGAVAEDIAERDARDATRAMSPLRQAEDAVVLDTTGLGIDEQVERVVALIRARQRDAAVPATPSS
ncbi:MAG: (d)CMP kinase [Bacteroidota bacterium]